MPDSQQHMEEVSGMYDITKYSFKTSKSREGGIESFKISPIPLLGSSKTALGKNVKEN